MTDRETGRQREKGRETVTRTDMRKNWTSQQMSQLGSGQTVK